MTWANEYKTLGVRTNADTPKDTAKAIELGAEGIGLCRTEHMFFDEERIFNLRKMILSETVEDREKYLNLLIPYQKGDFKEMYKELQGRPMTVRYIDPPLHEFIPKTEAEMKQLADAMGITVEHVQKVCNELHEFNPMMGHRGCRLAVTYPEIAKMQTRALMEAAIEVKEEEGYDIIPEIMIPLVGEIKELKLINSDSDLVITSDRLNTMSDDEIKNIFHNIKVVARAMPQDKSRLVDIAKSMDLVVGMTGDGVNDALALKKADVGFAMGSGTEVAKEASDIVILDNNFYSIAMAILYGRTIFKSIRKFIICQLTINLCSLLVSIIGPFIGIPVPITVVQMLWINMIMDTLSGFAFSYEPALIEYMYEKPKKKSESIINKYMFNQILITGLYSAILCIFFLKSKFINLIFGDDLMTAFFGLIIFISIFNSFAARTYRLNILGNIFQNKVFILVILFVICMQIILLYKGGELFRTSGLTISEFIVMMMFALTVIPVDFIRKVILKYRGKRLGV